MKQENVVQLNTVRDGVVSTRQVLFHVEYTHAKHNRQFGIFRELDGSLTEMPLSAVPLVEDGVSTIHLFSNITKKADRIGFVQNDACVVKVFWSADR